MSQFIVLVVSAVIKIFSQLSVIKNYLRSPPIGLVILCSPLGEVSQHYIMLSESDILSDCLERLSLAFCFLVECIANYKQGVKLEFSTNVNDNYSGV